MKKFNSKINITLRAGILDVQGKTVEQALHAIEFQNLSNVRIGKYVTLTVEAESETEARASVERACSQLIANPIIEDFTVAIEPAE